MRLSNHQCSIMRLTYIWRSENEQSAPTSLALPRYWGKDGSADTKSWALGCYNHCEHTLTERRRILTKHRTGEIEALVSVGVLTEGWDNPECNIIVHMRPTLSKVLWGQSVGRGLRASPGKNKCIVIDVSSNWTTFGPVEKLKWTLWSPPRSFLRYQNRFNWIGQKQDDEQEPETYLLCKNDIASGRPCSNIYLKNRYEGDACPTVESMQQLISIKNKGLTLLSTTISSTASFQGFQKSIMT